MHYAHQCHNALERDTYLTAIGCMECTLQVATLNDIIGYAMRTITLGVSEARRYNLDSLGVRCDAISVSLKSTFPNGGSSPLI